MSRHHSHGHPVLSFLLGALLLFLAFAAIVWIVAAIGEAIETRMDQLRATSNGKPRRVRGPRAAHALGPWEV